MFKCWKTVFSYNFTLTYMCSSHVKLSFSINMICTLCKCMCNICITFTVIFIQRLKQFDILSGCRSGQTSYVGQVRNLDQSQIELKESASLWIIWRNKGKLDQWKEAIKGWPMYCIDTKESVVTAYLLIHYATNQTKAMGW